LKNGIPRSIASAFEKVGTFLPTKGEDPALSNERADETIVDQQSIYRGKYRNRIGNLPKCDLEFSFSFSETLIFPFSPKLGKWEFT